VADLVNPSAPALRRNLPWRVTTASTGDIQTGNTVKPSNFIEAAV